MTILLGVNTYPAKGENARRQDEALATWRALTGVALANLQWEDELHEVGGIETFPVLRTDARTVSGARGRRLPVMSEIFDRLAEIAETRGHRFIAYANGDISFTQAAIDRVRNGSHRDGYALSRMDYDPDTRADLEMVTAGIDVIAVTVEWWRANRHRFRAYLAGEVTWDNVYTAILMAHGDAVILNREPLVRHERHLPYDTQGSPYARYLNYLAALDRPYFTLWAIYYDRLQELRARGASADEEIALQREVFRRRPSALERAVQAARVLKARAKWRTRGRA